MKASLAHDFGASNSVASLTLNRLVNGSDVQVKAIYKRAGDVFIMEEQWKVDKNTRINGRCVGAGGLGGGAGGGGGIFGTQSVQLNES